MKKCFITGATGHIGNVLVRDLLKKGFQVKALVRTTSDLSPLEGLEINLVYGQLYDRDFIFKQIEKDMVVFHLAGIIDISSKRTYEEIIKTNVDGTKNIVDACIANGAEKLVYTSTVHIIDEKSAKILKEPEAFENSKDITGAYASTKFWATKYVVETSKANKFPAVVVYPSGVIGPFDYKISELGQIVLDYMNHKLPAYVKGGYNFVDVRDVAFGILAAYEKGRACEGYILSGEQVDLKKMFDILNEKLGRKGYPFKAPIWLAKLFSFATNWLYKIRNKKPVYSSYSLTVLNSNCNFSNEKAINELGFAPRSAKQSLFDSIDWFIENKPKEVKQKYLPKNS